MSPNQKVLQGIKTSLSMPTWSISLLNFTCLTMKFYDCYYANVRGACILAMFCKFYIKSYKLQNTTYICEQYVQCALRVLNILMQNSKIMAFYVHNTKLDTTRKYSIIPATILEPLSISKCLDHSFFSSSIKLPTDIITNLGFDELNLVGIKRFQKLHK